MHDGRRVLVIVPAYNEGRVITDTVERLLAAGYQVVVVDDGSSDETAEGLEQNHCQQAGF